MEATCGVNGGAVGCVYSLTVCVVNSRAVKWIGSEVICVGDDGVVN